MDIEVFWYTYLICTVLCTWHCPWIYIQFYSTSRSTYVHMYSTTVSVKNVIIFLCYVEYLTALNIGCRYTAIFVIWSLSLQICEYPALSTQIWYFYYKNKKSYCNCQYRHLHILVYLSEQWLLNFLKTNY